MRDFPQESVKQAREIVARYRRRSTSKLEATARLYDGAFYHIGYGFSEAVRDGNCGKFLHEVKTETDCFAMAGVIYLIAREGELNPEIYLATRMQDHREGVDSGNDAGGDHTFVVVRPVKNKAYAVDKHMTAFGRVTFKPDENLILIRDKHNDTVIHRRYASIRKLELEEYLEMLEASRRPGGGRKALENTQSVNAAGGRRNYLTFSPKTLEIRGSLHNYTARCGGDQFDGCVITDLTTRVEDNGDFDFSNGTLSVYYARTPGWTEHDTPQVPISLPMKSVEELWKVWQEIVLGTGRKSVSRMITGKLADLLLREGFRDNFSVEEGSRAEATVRKLGEQKLRDFNDALGASLDNYIPLCKKDEVSFASLLRHAHYVRAADRARTGDNLYGFLSSVEERTELVRDEYRMHRQRVIRLVRNILRHTEVSAKLRNGSRYHSSRRFCEGGEREAIESRAFRVMSSLRSSSFPLVYDRVADLALFDRALVIKRRTVSELAEGVSDGDLARAAQWRTFGWLVEAFAGRNALYLASFRKGLKKILDVSGT